MHTTLFLRPDEQALFEKLPADIRNGWKLEEEKLTFTDTPQRRRVRIGLMRVDNKMLSDFQKDAGAADSAEALADVLKKLDMSTLSKTDLSELLFAAGPEALSLSIRVMIATAKTDEDVENVVAFALLRHGMLDSLQVFPS